MTEQARSGRLIGSPRGVADDAAESARRAQFEYEGALRSTRHARSEGGASARLDEEARRAASLAADRARATLDAWAEAEIQALKASAEQRARALDDEASANRVRNARNAAIARWRHRPPD